MKRKIVRIDEEKCNGCGLCVDACHEGALQLVDGKARLMSESYCDGLGNCLPECPAGAITIEERDADAFDEEAVKKQLETAKAKSTEKPGPEASCGCGGVESASAPEDVPEKLACGCPVTSARLIERGECAHGAAAPQQAPALESQLRQWPCQIKLAPVSAPYLDNADLLVAADCTAYAYANIHSDFMRNRVTLIGCPKLDDTDYTEKLTEILKAHEIRSIKVLRMEAPCCGGIVNAVKQAIINSGRMIPWGVVTVGTDGRIVEDI
jgi:ferredoxin